MVANAIHDDMIRATAYVTEVEGKLADAIAKRDEFESAYKLAQGEADMLRYHINKVQQRSDYYQRRMTELLTRLKSSAGVILECLKEEPIAEFIPSGQAHVPDNNLGPSALGDDGEPVPAFLTHRSARQANNGLRADEMG